MTSLAMSPPVVMLTPADLLLPTEGALSGEQRDWIGSLLSEHGFVLFRGFDIASDQRFHQVVESFGYANFRYADSFSNAVRTNRTERVFTANEAPATVEIFLHHEMAQTLTFPSRLFFYCEQAATTGGATPICRSDWALQTLAASQPEFIARLKQQGVRYRNTMPSTADGGSGQGRSWRDTLSVATREEAETKLSALGYRYSWLADNALSVQTPALPAVVTAPDGVDVFFNQIVAAGAGWQKRADDNDARLCYGDGSPLEPEVIDAAIAACYQHTVDLEWQTGDVALLDNYKVMHGRRPFKGTRRVLASLCSAVSRSALPNAERSSVG